MPDPAPWLLALACAAGTYLFRGIGVALSGRMTTESELFNWVSCVAYAMIAGLIVRIIVAPAGLLTQTLLVDRVGSVVVAMGAFFLLRRHMFGAMCAGTGTLIIINYLRSAG